MIEFKQKGDFKSLNSWFEKARESINLGILDKYGRRGVEALSAATPKDTGNTADSWYYEISHENGVATISFFNSSVIDGWSDVSLAILLQYGHASKGGGYVQGIDYINPALKPIFEEIADEAWKEVSK